MEHNHENIMTLTLDDGSTLKVEPLVTIGHQDKEYVAVTEVEQQENVYFFEFVEVGENEIELHNVEDDEILKALFESFEEWEAKQDAE